MKDHRFFFLIYWICLFFFFLSGCASDNESPDSSGNALSQADCSKINEVSTGENGYLNPSSTGLWKDTRGDVAENALDITCARIQFGEKDVQVSIQVDTLPEQMTVKSI